MSSTFVAVYHGDIQGGIMHRFHAEWIGGLLRIGDKGGPPFEDEKVISFGDLDATQAAQFAAWIIHRLPPRRIPKISRACWGEVMTPTICGHERDVLIWALTKLNSPTMGQTYMRLANGGKPIEPGHDAKYAALQASIDPAKLAAIMAEALRERGIEARMQLPANMSFELAAFGIIDPSIGGMVEWSGCCYFRFHEFRAAILRVLTLPDGATAAGAMKALRPEYADPDELLNTMPNTESLERRQNESNPGRRR